MKCNKSKNFVENVHPLTTNDDINTNRISYELCDQTGQFEMEDEGESVFKLDDNFTLKDEVGKKVNNVKFSRSTFNKDTLSPEDF